MSNYISKEKKPVLNREIIKKDLKHKSDAPFFLYCFLAFCLVFSLAFIITAIAMLCSPDGASTENDIIYSIIALVIFVPIVAVLVFLLYCGISTPIQIKKNRFYVFTDTIDYKVEREEVRCYSKHKRHRYPSVIYFKKCGRYEVCYDIRGMYNERNPRLESSAQRTLDEYELDKTYYVVSLNQKNPSAVLIYDPDKYDVQL